MYGAYDKVIPIDLINEAITYYTYGNKGTNNL